MNILHSMDSPSRDGRGYENTQGDAKHSLCKNKVGKRCEIQHTDGQDMLILYAEESMEPCILEQGDHRE